MNTRRCEFFTLGTTAALLIATTFTSNAFADYPLVGYRYLADPGSVVYKGRIYLYNSNDDDNNGSYGMKSIVCVSSADLKNWTDHGIVFQVPKDASWAGNSWAPQPIQRDGTVYLYFGNSGSGIGVASSTDPAGEFKDAKGSYLVSSSTSGVITGGWLFDPGALIDDDGSAYLSFGGNGDAYSQIVKLGDNLASVSGSVVHVSSKDFYEASFLFKRNGNYYYAYSTTPAAGMRIDYLMSKSPMSGYAYTGTIADGPPQNDNNNHASELEFNGKWYHAYHNRYVAKQAGIDATYKRNLGIELLEFNADDTIKKVTYTTDGVVQVGTLDPYVRVEAETTNASSGIETETCSEGGMDVTSISSGDWIRVRGVNFGTAGAKTFTARVAASAAGGGIELHLTSLTGTLIGTCSVPSTGGTQTWQTATCDVTGATGVQDLYFKFTGGNFNFNYWQFTGGDGEADGGTGADGSTGAGGSSATSGGGGSSGSGGASSVGSGGTKTSGSGGASSVSSGGTSGAGGGGTKSGTSATSGGGGNSTATSTTSGNSGGGSSGTAGSSHGSSGTAGTQSGSGGKAGSGSGGGTATGSSGGTASEPAGDSSSGCGCEVGRHRTSYGPLGFFLLGLLGISRRRRTGKSDERAARDGSPVV